MSWDPTIGDDEFEGLLEGDARAAETNLDLTRFVDDLRTAYPPDAPAADAHLAAIMETATLSADNGDPAAMPASNADAPVLQVSRLPKRKGNTMKDRKWRILVLRVAAPIVALFTVLGIMGSAGALPRGLQRMTSNVAGVVGLDLPSGEDTEGDEGTTDTQDDQGENDDSQGDATDATNQDDQGENQNDQGDATSADDNQGDDNSQGDATDATNQDDQGENDDSQGDSTSPDPSNQDDQGENDQGDSTNRDDQGDNSQDEGSSGGSSGQDDQGDDSGSGSGDSGSGSGSGDGNSQD